MMTGKFLASVPAMRSAPVVATLDAAALSESVFKADYVANSLPCLIRGAVRHWPALTHWRDPDYLKRRAGHHGVHLYTSEYHITKTRLLPNQKVVGFAEAVDYLHSETATFGMVPSEILRELQSDLGGLSFLSRAEPGFWYRPARYFFYRNAGTAWHYHPFDETLTCQIVGTKKIGLVSCKSAFHPALRDIFFTEQYYDDPAIFARAADASVDWFSATLEEGDALYIPPLWWHGVEPFSQGFGATAPVTWRSPLHVVADGIKRMAGGELDLLGQQGARDFPALLEVARKMGLEAELAMACKASQAAQQGPGLA